MADTNNFSSYKTEFKTDTGFDWNTNIHAYIQYVQARLLDLMVQQQKEMLAKFDSGIHLATPSNIL